MEWGEGIDDEGFGLGAGAPLPRGAQPPMPGMPPMLDPGMAGSHSGASALLGRVPGVMSHVDLAALDMTSRTSLDDAARAATSDAQRAGVTDSSYFTDGDGDGVGGGFVDGFDDSLASGLPDDILTSAMDVIPVGPLPGAALSDAKAHVRAALQRPIRQLSAEWLDDEASEDAEDEGVASAAMQLALRRDMAKAAGDQSGSDSTGGGDVSGWRSSALNLLEKPHTHTFASDALQIEAVRSWRPVGTVAVKGLGVTGDGDADAGTGIAAVRRMPELEAKYKQEVGPHVGFDLDRIGAHYAHRAAVRERHPALSSGEIVPLRALHRYGVHSHVLAFARPLVDKATGRSKSIAVVACNFNHAPSTFHVRCSRVAPLIGALEDTAGDPTARGLSRRPTPTAWSGAGKASFDPVSGMDPAIGLDDAFGVFGSTAPVRPVSLEAPYSPHGGVWEVRDAFAGSVTPKEGGSSTNGPFVAHDSGPMIGLLTSNETAFAPMNTTLKPYGSVCWLFTQRDIEEAAPVRTLANVQWLFASALQRLQSILRLKEASSSGVAASAGVSESARMLLSGGKPAEEAGSSRWTPPWEILNDREIWAAARSNVVGSLCRLTAVATARFYYAQLRKGLS